MDKPTQTRIATLHPSVRNEVTTIIQECDKALTGRATVRVTQGLRTFAEQDALYQQGNYWITRIPTTLTILQSGSTGLQTEKGQPLPIFPEPAPQNCENPAELETATEFKLDDVQMVGTERASTLYSQYDNCQIS